MAIRIDEQYPGKTAGANSNYPHGEARNVTAPGDGTGTPWEKAIVNDDQGFKQALLEEAGITPSGTPDTAVASQYLQALKKVVQAMLERSWSVQTSERAFNTEYTNPSALDMEVAVTISASNASENIDVLVGGVLVFRGVDEGSAGWKTTLYFTVPAGKKYRVNLGTPGSATINHWAELKAVSV